MNLNLEEMKSNQEIPMEQVGAYQQMKVEVFLEELRARGKDITGCLGVTEACIEQLKAILDRMEATDFEATETETGYSRAAVNL